MSDKNQLGVIRVRSNLLGELIVEKNAQFSSLVENLKKFEGYSLGTKEASDKIISYVKAQRAELTSLVSQQKLHPEIAKFTDALLDKIVAAARVASSEGEKLLFTKQGETISVKQEAERLVALKATHDVKIKEIEATKTVVEEKKETVESPKEQDTPTKKRIPKQRPDKDPNTKIGRAAMDVMERRKKKQS